MEALKNRIARYIIPEGIPWFAASLYDKIARTAITSYYQKVAEEIVAAIDSGRMLDIGTGPGYLPIEIAKRKSNLHIDGIDLTKKMIKIAQKNALQASVANQLHFEVGNANKLRFKDNSYDMVISTGAFHSWKNPVKVINECYRVLKPGKEAWIYDPARIAYQENGSSRIRPFRVLDWFTYHWIALLSKIQPRERTHQEIREIISQTKFRIYEVSGNRWVFIKLRK